MRKIAVLALGVVTMLAIAAQDGILLRRQLTPNTTDVYTVEMKSVNSTTMGDALVDGTMKMTYKYGQLDKDGKADLEIITSDTKLKLGGIAEMAEAMMGQLPKTSSIKAKIDDRNRVTDMKAVGTNAQMALLTGSQGSSGQSIAFPEKPVKVGDIWEIVMPANKAAGMGEAKLTGKLLSEKSVDGVVTYVISMYGTIPVKMNMAEMMKDAPGGAGAGGMMADLVVTGKVDLKMDAVIEKSTGRTLEATMTAKNVGTITGDALPMAFDTTGTTTVKMTLTK